MLPYSPYVLAYFADFFAMLAVEESLPQSTQRKSAQCAKKPHKAKSGSPAIGRSWAGGEALVQFQTQSFSYPMALIEPFRALRGTGSRVPKVVTQTIRQDHSGSAGQLCAAGPKQGWVRVIVRERACGPHSSEKWTARAARALGDPATRGDFVQKIASPTLYLYVQRFTRATAGQRYWSGVDS